VEEVVEEVVEVARNLLPHIELEQLLDILLAKVLELLLGKACRIGTMTAYQEQIHHTAHQGQAFHFHT